MADLMEDVGVRSVSTSCRQRASELSLGSTVSCPPPGGVVPALLPEHSVGPQGLDASKHPLCPSVWAGCPVLRRACAVQAAQAVVACAPRPNTISGNMLELFFVSVLPDWAQLTFSPWASFLGYNCLVGGAVVLMLKRQALGSHLDFRLTFPSLSSWPVKWDCK